MLRQLAEQDPGNGFRHTARPRPRRGGGPNCPAFWAEMAMRPALPAELRRQLAFRVLDAGDKPRAEQVFRTLAAAAPPRSPDVRMLLFIWGPRPAAEQLDWIEARARRAGGADKAEWMNILVGAGAATRAVAVYRSSRCPGTRPSRCPMPMRPLSSRLETTRGTGRGCTGATARRPRR